MNERSALAGKRCLFALCGFELGGAERQALHLARHLQAEGCSVKVWGHHHRWSGAELVIEHCEAAGIPWAEHRFRWPSRKTDFLRDGSQWLRGLWREKPEIVLSYTPWPSVACGLFWRLSPAKAFIWGQRDTGDLRGDAVERFACRSASAVVCNAAHEVDYLRRALGEIPGPVSVIHNGIELPPAENSRREWRISLGIDRETPVATMLANFRPQKDHGALLHAWKRLLDSRQDAKRPPRLLLAGAPQDSHMPAHRLAADLGLLDTVTFLDQVRDITGLLAATDVGVLISSHEGLPNAVLEYMAAGLPVVATDLPGNREALGDDPGQPLCAIGDEETLAAVLATLIDGPSLRERLGSRNRERAAAEFSIDSMCVKSVRLIANLLNCRSGRSDARVKTSSSH